MKARLKWFARRALLRAAHILIRARSQPWPTRTPAACTLVVAPHQDDETLGCGGLIARRHAAGETVHIAFITDGSGSHPGHPTVNPGQLALLRLSEARAAAAALGLPSAQLHFFDAPDGQLPHLDPPARLALVERLRRLITALGPSELFITTSADGSTEHTAAHALVRAALLTYPQTSPPRLFEYPVWSRWNPRFLRASLLRPGQIYLLPLAPAEMTRKHRALLAYQSQIAPIPPCSSSALPPEFLQMFDDPWECFFEFPARS